LIRRFVTSLIIATFATLASAALVSAYTAPGSALATISSCSTVNPASQCTIVFQLKDAKGVPEPNATVNFSVSGVQGASVQPASAITDAGGNAATVFLPNTGGGCGTATVTASSPPASAQTNINVTCSTNGTLPNNSTSAPTTPLWLAALVALALVAVAACGMALRRIRVTS
jgi:hypothetical protein